MQNPVTQIAQNITPQVRNRHKIVWPEPRHCKDVGGTTRLAGAQVTLVVIGLTGWIWDSNWRAKMYASFKYDVTPQKLAIVDWTSQDFVDT